MGHLSADIGLPHGRIKALDAGFRLVAVCRIGPPVRLLKDCLRSLAGLAGRKLKTQGLKSAESESRLPFSREAISSSFKSAAHREPGPTTSLAPAKEQRRAESPQSIRPPTRLVGLPKGPPCRFERPELQSKPQTLRLAVGLSPRIL